ncbi:MAG: ABC transporter ATP-binding protein [Clostridia bacterium]|nr:ABC transporter ATP-binding protein [Clostridia bacterium]
MVLGIKETISKGKKYTKTDKKEKAPKKAKNSHYISRAEQKRISKENSKAIKYFEKRKKRKVKVDEYTTEMKDENNVIEFDDLHTYFFSDAGTVKAVNGVTFSIPAGSTVGVVGESGCGKSVTSLSLMQLVQAPSGQIVSGSIRFKSNMFKLNVRGKKIPVYEKEVDENGVERIKKDEKGKPIIKRNELGGNLYEMEERVVDIAKMPTSAVRNIRGREIAMIFQEPMTSLNPVFTIGNQLDEVGLLHIEGISKEKVKERSIEMLKLVGIADLEGVYKKYPHELSGGMRQRVMIAIALLCNPKLIVADEPTTALDVTIQAQILDLLREIKTKINGSIMLITHDLGVVAEMADYVVVMYAGKVIEMGTAEDIFDRPMHPYTIGLQKSKPTVDQETDKLYCIPGFVPNPINMPNYCYFRDRCEKCIKKCSGEYPQLVKVSDTHSVSCYLYEDYQKGVK